jgi:hypothetical protein
MRYGIFKRISNGFHCRNYRASYTINAFRSNFEFDKDPNGWMRAVTFFNKTIMSNLVEQFNPLMRMDFELKSSLKVLAEIKKTVLYQ